MHQENGSDKRSLLQSRVYVRDIRPDQLEACHPANIVRTSHIRQRSTPVAPSALQVCPVGANMFHDRHSS